MMGLRDDIDAADRCEMGMYGAYLRGEYTPPPAPYPSDPSAKGDSNTYAWMRKRGD